MLGKLLLDVVIPWSPSTNRLWRRGAGRGMYKTAKARGYGESVALVLHEQGQARIRYAGRVGVRMELFRPTRAVVDTDNRVKAVLDALQECEMLLDDEQVDYLEVTKRQAVRRGGAICLKVYEWSEGEGEDDGKA